ncbi:MAG TPA: DinB family protein [Chloroflexota bacterium]|nr:DinB family protein [Chloroflexota bacterium]
MAPTTGQDFRGERLDDADFSRARLHSPNFEDARITDGWLHNADISGYIDGLRVNGVEVAPLVEAELDRRFPIRVKLRADDPQGLADAWTLIEEVWRTTVAHARTLPEVLLFERVDDDWSFVETLRHLVLATDIWLFRMIRGMPRPYHPWGLAGSFLTDPARLGLTYDATPSLDEVLAVRRERMDAVKETIAALTREELARVCVPPDAAEHPTEPHSVVECLHVILDEEWEHSRYANRDLDILAAGAR